VSDNICTFPPAETMTPEQALQSALQFAEQKGLKDCIIIGYDNNDCFLVRSSRMDLKLALWLAEMLRLHILSD